MKKTIAAFLLMAFSVMARADSTTTRMGITKPSIGSTGWGTKTNNNWDIVDSAVSVLAATNTYTSTNTFNGFTQLSTTSVSTQMGVGTTSPSASLDVEGTFFTSGGFYSDNSGHLFGGDSTTSGLFFNSQGQFQARRQGGQNATIRIESVGGGTSYLAFDNTGGTFTSPSTTTLRIIGSVVGVGWDGATVGAMQHGPEMRMLATEKWTSTSTPSSFEFYTIPSGSTSQTNTLELLNAKVGIVNTSPSATLDVGGTMRSTTQGAPTSGTGAEVYYDGTNGNVIAFNRTGSSWVPLKVEGSTLLLNTTNGGNVGINTTTPQTILDVAGAAQFGNAATKSTFTATGGLQVPFGVTAGTITLANLTSGRVATVGTSGLIQDDSDFTFNGTTATITGASHTNLIVSGASSLAAINGTGLVTINEGSNTDQIKAKGTGETAYFHAGVFSGESYLFNNFSYNGAFTTDNSAIGSSGVILGSDTIKIQNAVASATPSRSTAITIAHQAIQFNNYGAGAITADASGNLTSVSDGRLKDVQGPFTRGLADVLKITPQNYKWKVSTGYDREHVYSGFIAQDVLPAIPEAVWKNKDGYYSFQDRPVLAAMLNAIKELSAKVDALQKRVQVLETEKGK